jgi:hypothetical protein
MEDNKYNLKIYWKCNENAIIKCLFYMFVLEFKGLNGYYICPIEWNSKDWMANVYVSFGIVGSHGYCLCILWNSKDLITIMYASFGALRGMMSYEVHQKPFCASTHGAQTSVRLCIHIWFNIDIIVRCPCGSDDVWVCVVDILEYFFYYSIFWHVTKFIKEYPFDMDSIYLEYFFLHLLTTSCSCSHVHKVTSPH